MTNLSLNKIILSVLAVLMLIIAAITVTSGDAQAGGFKKFKKHHFYGGYGYHKPYHYGYYGHRYKKVWGWKKRNFRKFRGNNRRFKR